MSLDITLRKQQLNAFFVRIISSQLPEEAQSDLAKHGTVLVCGFIERSVELIIMDKIKNRAHPRVLNFVRRYFKKGTNYDCEAISQLLERFDLTWSANFRAFLNNNNDIVEAVASAYRLRNSIAHGGTASLGINQAKELYVAAEKLVDGMFTATS